MEWTPGKNDLTKRFTVTLPLAQVLTYQGARGENHQFHTRNNATYFGRYPLAKWMTFVEDIAANGITEEIMLYVEQDGTIFVGEGNHRIQAAKQVGIDQIIVDVRFFGGSEKISTLAQLTNTIGGGEE